MLRALGYDGYESETTQGHQRSVVSNTQCYRCPFAAEDVTDESKPRHRASVFGDLLAQRSDINVKRRAAR